MKTLDEIMEELPPERRRKIEQRTTEFRQLDKRSASEKGIEAQANIGNTEGDRKMSQYDPLYRWLRSKGTNDISTNFSEIEKILAFKLPMTARKRPQWWANELGKSRHVQCRAWIDAGYETRNVNLLHETLEFVATSS